MENETSHLSRREFVRLAGITAGWYSLAGVAVAEMESGTAGALFDGKTLNGWLQIENNATSLSVGQIADQTAFVDKLISGSDAVTAFLRGQLEDTVKASMAAYSASNADSKVVMSALVKDLNRVISGPSIYDKARFSSVALRPETEELLKQNPRGQQLARLNKLLLEDAYTANLARPVQLAGSSRMALWRARAAAEE